MEIVCLSFDPHGMLVATGSMDNSAKLWDVETGQEIFSLDGHHAEIVSLHFNTDGDTLERFTLELRCCHVAFRPGLFVNF